MSRKAAAQIVDQPSLDLKDKNEDDKLKAVQEPDIDVEIEGEENLKAAEDKQVEKKDDEQKADVADLQKRLDELLRAEEANKKAVETARREREEAVARQREIEAEVTKHRSDAAQAQLDAIEAAISTAKAEAEGAERDLETAIANGDPKAQSDAARRIARAESNVLRLEDGKAELEHRIEASKAEKVEKKEPEARQQDPIEALNVPPSAKDWLRDHPEYVDDARKNLKLQSTHFDALDEGHKPFSTDYFIALEKLLGLRKAEQPKKQEQRHEEDDDNADDDLREAIVSAPVSRDSGGGGNNGGGGSRRTVRLTKEQQEAAKVAGVSEKVYAENLLRLNEAKKNGHYGEGR